MAVRRTAIGRKEPTRPPPGEMSNDDFSRAISKNLLRSISVFGGTNPGICGDYDKYRITWRVNIGFESIRHSTWREGLAGRSVAPPTKEEKARFVSDTKEAAKNRPEVAEFLAAYLRSFVV